MWHDWAGRMRMYWADSGREPQVAQFFQRQKIAPPGCGGVASFLPSRVRGSGWEARRAPGCSGSEAGERASLTRASSPGASPCGGCGSTFGPGFPLSPQPGVTRFMAAPSFFPRPGSLRGRFHPRCLSCVLSRG